MKAWIRGWMDRWMVLPKDCPSTRHSQLIPSQVLDPHPNLGSLPALRSRSEGSPRLPGCAVAVGASRDASSQISTREDRAGPGLGARPLQGIPGGILAVHIPHQCGILAPLFPGAAGPVHPELSPGFQPLLALILLLIPVLVAEREAESRARGIPGIRRRGREIQEPPRRVCRQGVASGLGLRCDRSAPDPPGHGRGGAGDGGAAGPIPADPVPTDPIRTDPIPTDPIPTDPSPADPIPTDPIPTDPILTDPSPTDIIPTHPTFPNRSHPGRSQPSRSIPPIPAPSRLIPA